MRIRVVPIARQYPQGTSGALTPSNNPDAFEDAFLALRYSVNGQGRVEDVTVIESDPPDMEDFNRKVISLFSKGVFRPRFADGLPVLADEQVYRHEYKLQTVADMEPARGGEDSGALEYPDSTPMDYPDEAAPES